MEDWDNEQHIKLATERGKSQLTLGHSVDRKRKKRGDGFELRTDMKGAIARDRACSCRPMRSRWRTGRTWT